MITKNVFVVVFVMIAGFVAGMNFRALLSPEIVFAQAKALEIGDVSVRIGSPSEEVLSRLGRRFALENGGEVPQGEVWFATSKDASREVSGSVIFRKGVVVEVTRSWDTLDDPDAKTSRFIKNLYNALDRITTGQPEGTFTQIGCRRTTEPSHTSHLTLFLVGSQSVSLALHERVLPSGANSDYMEISETLSSN